MSCDGIVLFQGGYCLLRRWSLALRALGLRQVYCRACGVPLTKEWAGMPLHALVYCSRAAPGLTLYQVDDIASDAADHNLIAGVTGVLLIDGKRFLQYIEGPEEGVALAYSRITNSRSHTDIVELGRSQGGQRRFPYWSMRWLPVEPEDLRIAEVSDWRGLAYREETAVFQVPTGIERMTELVNPFVDLDLDLVGRGSDGSPLF